MDFSLFRLITNNSIMIKKTIYFGNPVYLSLKNSQLVIKFPEIEKNEDLPSSLRQQSEITKLMDTPAGEYNSSSVLIGEDGAIYYKNDSGNLFRISTVSDNTFFAIFQIFSAVSGERASSIPRYFLSSRCEKWYKGLPAR